MKPDRLSIEIEKLLRKNGGDATATLHQIKARLAVFSMRFNSCDLELAELRRRLSYDPVTGLFTWLEARSDRKGKAIYGGDKSSYVYITLNGRAYLAHILAWFYMTGDWPDQNIDHENGLGKDNRWENLRKATQSQNCANTALSPKANGLPRGVYDRGKGVLRFRASIKVRGKQILLGAFSTPDEAGRVYDAACLRYFGEFAYSNRSP